METRLLLVVSTLIMIHTTFNSWSAVESTKFTIENNCPHPIWPAAVAKSAHSPPLDNTGFALGQAQSQTIEVPSGWMGLFWARTFCTTNASSSSGFTCAVGDCGTGEVPCRGKSGAPPTTAVEFTLDGYANNDFYDVSLVSGFNLPVRVTPRADECPSAGCVGDVNGACPQELVVRGPDGVVIGCKSACVAFDTDEYCCRGEFSSDLTCVSSNYSRYFRSKCPQAASYRGDGRSIICPNNGGGYVITFCPNTRPKFIGMLCQH